MSRFLLLLFFATFASAGLSGTYKWVDEEGRTHYSDEPRKGESGDKQADLPEISTVDPGRTPSNPAPQGTEGATDDVVYELVRVVRPAEGQVIWLDGEPIRLAAATNPPLKPGHRVRFLIDGKAVHDEPARRPSLELDALPPGRHTLRVRVVSTDGDGVAESAPVTFEVRRPE